MMICPKCGAENADGDVVCRICGGNLTEKKAVNDKFDGAYKAFRSAEVPTEEKTSPKKSRRKEIGNFFSDHKKWILCGGVFLLVLLLLLLLLSRCSRSEKDKPDVGLLALTQEYIRYSLSDEAAEGGYPLVGLMDSEGNALTEAVYQSFLAEVADDRFAVIGSNAKIGVIDRNGKEIIPCKYRNADLITGYSDGLWAVQSGDVWGYVDKNGTERIVCQYEEAAGFSEGLAAVSNGRFWGYLDEEGQLTIDYRFDEAFPFDGGLACVCVDGQYGFIDRTGQFVIEPQFDEAYPYFEDGLCLIRVGSRYGYIDAAGEYVINPQFDDALPFSENLAAVMLEDKVGYIDRNGKYVIKPIYDAPEGRLTAENLFYNGYAVVYEEDVALLLDKSGNKVAGSSLACSEISHLHDGFAVVCVEGKYGLLDPKTGDYIKEPTYEKLLFTLRDGAVFAGTKEGVSILVNGSGEVVKELGSAVSAASFYSNINKNVRALALWLETRG